jgi:hypothetical protein
VNRPWTAANVFGALYAWSAAVFLGAVLLDVVYSSLLGDAGGAFLQSVYRQVSDFLLIIGAPTFLTALAAIALSWDSRPARNLFLISLLFLSLEFILPVMLLPVLRTPPDSVALGISPYIRLVPLGLASILALTAFCTLFREPEPAHT